MSNDQSILVTRATGSFGMASVRTVLDRFPRLKRLIVFSHACTASGRATTPDGRQTLDRTPAHGLKPPG
jgi:hypothetical protein